MEAKGGHKTEIIDMTDILEKYDEIFSQLEWPVEEKNLLEKFQSVISNFAKAHKPIILRTIGVIVLCGYFVYFGFALSYDFEASIALLVITCLVVAWLSYLFIKYRFGDSIVKFFQPLSSFLKSIWPTLQWFVRPAIAVLIILYLSSILQDSRQIISVAGLIIFMSIALLTCKYPSKIKWKPVIWGMGIQFILGIAVLRWRPGYLAVSFLADNINKFLFYCFDGAAVVFGDPMFLLHPFLMIVLPLLVYVGAVTGLCYHLGIVQWLVNKIGFWMRLTLGTTGIESISLALNIFLSVAESVLILRPYVPKLTKSEFHTLLCGAHATIAGWAFALFVLFGVDAKHLLTAAVMSAPAAVAIAKLNYPETEESLFKHEDDCQMESTAKNFMEAMTSGAYEAAKTVTSLMVQIIAFMSIYSFANATIAWLGGRVGLTLNFSVIFSYVFMPLVPLIGIGWEESQQVAEILGLKLTANEVLAYVQLGRMRMNGILTTRTSALTTYAICGFSSFGTLAMFVGVWTTVDVHRVRQVSALIPRIYMNTNLACFVTACVAGILYDESITTPTEKPLIDFVALLGLLPSYKVLMPLIGL